VSAADVDRVVALLTTGGTVSTTTDGATGRSASTLGADELAGLAAMPGITFDRRALSQVPSWTLDPAAMARIAIAARDVARVPSVTGVVVSHGTTTLEYSAFLADLVLDVDTPVIFTGAMRRADEPDPDGPQNLRDAIAVAVEPASRGRGVLVVFAGQIVAGGRVWKAQRTDAAAFIGLDGDMGSVIDGAVELGRSPSRGIPFSGRLETRVGFVKAVPGADGAMVEAAERANPRGLVIEGLPGVGGIPPGMTEAVRDAAARMPVVIASRAPFGRLPAVPTGGTGEPLRDVGLWSADNLTAEQAWLLLMMTLGEGGTRDEMDRRFASAASAQA
jgi:L-asparaginase